MGKINFLWIDTGVITFFPYRLELLQAIDAKSNLHVLSDKNTKAGLDTISELNNFVKRNSIQYILLDPWLVLQTGFDDSGLKYNIFNHPNTRENIKFLSTNLRQIECKKILLGPWIDTFSLFEEEVQNIIDFLDDGNYVYLTQIKNVEYEIHNKNYGRGFTKYFDSVDINQKYAKSHIPYVNCFSIRKFTGKEFLIHVPGSSGPGAYPKRNLLIEKIVNEKLNDETYNLVYNHQREIHFKIQSTKNPIYVQLSNYFYYDLIAKSKFNYIDGGIMNYPIRKYVEVPSLGSVFLSPRIKSLQDFGFEVGKHYFEIDYEANLKDFIYSISDDNYKNVLSESRKLVDKLHTNEKRIDDFIKSINMIEKSEYRGSEYVNGELFFR